MAGRWREPLRSYRGVTQSAPHFLRAECRDVDPLAETIEEARLPSRPFLVLAFGDFGRSAEGVLDSRPRRGVAEGFLGSGEEILIDLDRRSLRHAYIL